MIAPSAEESRARGRDRAEARARAYRLLGDLLSRGPTPAALEVARRSGLLAEAIDSYPEGDMDALAVDHQHAFGWAVHPWEGAFLDRDGRVGGERAAPIRALYELAGYRWDPTGDDPEHVATELRALSTLSGAEADAVEDGLADVVAHVRGLSRRLLDEHLLRFLPLLCVAVGRLGRAFPSALLDQAMELALLHRSELGAPWPEPLLLGGEELSLDDPETGLRELAEELSRPARAGFFLGREELGRLGREVSVPRGFGDSRTLIHNLLRSSVQFDALAPVAERLAVLASEQSAEIERRLSAVPELAPLAVAWRQRAERMRTLLERLGEAAAEGFLSDAPDEPEGGVPEGGVPAPEDPPR